MLVLNQKKIKKGALLFFALVFCLFLLNVLFFVNISSVEAAIAEVTWPKVPGIDKQIIQGQEIPLALQDLVKYLFNFSIMIAGLAAFFMFVWGGFRYLTSAGNPGAQKDSQDILTSAVLGLLLLLSSYLLLQTINPDVLILKPITLSAPAVPVVPPGGGGGGTPQPSPSPGGPINVPPGWAALFEDAGKALNVPPAIIGAIYLTERNTYSFAGDVSPTDRQSPCAISSAGAKGPFQLMPSWQERIEKWNSEHDYVLGSSVDVCEYKDGAYGAAFVIRTKMDAFYFFTYECAANLGNKGYNTLLAKEEASKIGCRYCGCNMCTGCVSTVVPHYGDFTAARYDNIEPRVSF